MIAQPKQKCPLTIKDNFSGIKTVFSLDPAQKWNVIINERDHNYQLNKGKSGTLYIPESLFNAYFYLLEEKQ